MTPFEDPIRFFKYGVRRWTSSGALVAGHNPSRRLIFDLFLAAQALSHNVHTICTYNTADFRGIAGLEAVTPEDLLERYSL